MRSMRWLWIFSLAFFVWGCTKVGTHSLSLRYQPAKELTSLQQKIGPSIGIAPFKDDRSEKFYIGQYTNLQGDSSYFKSQPFPLEEAIRETLTDVLSRCGVKTVPILSWDGEPKSLKGMEVDSVLMIEIKKFWIEGKASLFRTKMNAMVQLVIHLGVKREGKVFLRNVEVEKEATIAKATPERVEGMVNQALRDIFDAYFSNPY